MSLLLLRGVQVIQLTRELQQSQQPRPAGQGLAQEGLPQESAGPSGAAGAATIAAPAGSVSSQLLPPQVAEQIRHAQRRAALSGQGPADWAVGAECRAVYSGDGNWCEGWQSLHVLAASEARPLVSCCVVDRACMRRRYDAVVEGVTAGGFMVLFEGYGSREEVGRDAVQLRAAEDESGYKGEHVS